MKKNPKTSIALFLLAAMLFAGCSGPAGSGDDTSVGDTSASSDTTTEPELTDGLEDVDMDGFSLTFLSYDGSNYWWARYEIDATEENADTVNDSIYRRNIAIEDRFKAQIQEKKVAKVESDLDRDVMAGTADWQVAMVYDQKLVWNLLAGSLMMWDDMPGCDLSNPWWNADANNVFRMNGKQYAAVGDFNLSEYSKSYMFYFNKDLYSTRNSVEELYATALEGKWTYDKLLTLTEQYVDDLNGDGAYDDRDQYGLSGFPHVMYQQLLTGAGLKYVEIDEETGNPYFAVPGNEKFVTVAQTLVEGFGNNTAYFNTYDDVLYRSMFSENKLVFVAATMYDTEYFRSFDINIGMLPSPKWDEEQKDYYSITVGGVVSALPKTLPVADQEYTGMLMEAMAFASRQDTLPAYKEVVLQGRYADDPESAEMVDIIFGSQTYDLGVTTWDIRGRYTGRIFDPCSTDVVSATEAIRGETEPQILDAIEAVIAQSQE